MKFGTHLYELWRLRVGLVVSLVLAVLVSLSTAYRISLFPPGLHSRALEMSAASTHVLVDDPRDSVVLDLGVGSAELDQMSQRALVLANVMASLPVRSYIARRAGVPAQVIQVSPPLTAQNPLPIAGDPHNQRKTTDLVRSNNQYRISIKANPTVPIIDVYSEASSVRTAKALANGAVGGLRDYLRDVARGQGVPTSRQPRLEQLGRAEGDGVTGAVNVEVAILVFGFVFALSSAATLGLARVRRGWRLSRGPGRLRTAPPATNGAAHLTDDELHRATSG